LKKNYRFNLNGKIKNYKNLSQTCLILLLILIFSLLLINLKKNYYYLKNGNKVTLGFDTATPQEPVLLNSARPGGSTRDPADPGAGPVSATTHLKPIDPAGQPVTQARPDQDPFFFQM